MHVRIGILLTVLLVLSAPATHANSTAGVRMLACEPADADSDGFVVYRARMRAVPDTARMALRIRLFEKRGDGEFERLEAEDLGVWRKSRRGVLAFRWTQAVEGLREGAVYRAVVHFRWIDKRGDVIQAARRRSEACSKEGGLPNLRVAGIRVRPGEVEGTAVYKATIVNRGAVSAHSVGVLLRVDGEIVDEEVIDAVPAKQTRTVTFNGPVCHDRMRVVVDPKDLITETREQDNARGSSCL